MVKPSYLLYLGISVSAALAVLVIASTLNTQPGPSSNPVVPAANSPSSPTTVANPSGSSPISTPDTQPVQWAILPPSSSGTQTDVSNNVQQTPPQDNGNTNSQNNNAPPSNPSTPSGNDQNNNSNNVQTGNIGGGGGGGGGGIQTSSNNNPNNNGGGQVGFSSNLLCIDMATGHDVQDESPIAMHTVVHCDSSTSNSNAVSYQLVVINGNGVQTQNTGILPGKSVSTTFTVDTPNMWSVVVTYYDAHGAKIGRELINLQVSFFVLPESPLGVAALTASSMAALGGFMVYKRRKLQSA